MIEDKSIDLESIMNIIQSQLSVLVNLPENAELFAGVRLICSLEQQFMKIKDKDRHAIYIVVRLGSSSVVFGQTVLPVTIMALTEENKIELTRNLLMQYALTFNLKRVDNDTIQQVYEAPNVISNFEAVYSGYRSVINVSGVFVVSPHVNFYNLWYYQNLNVPTVDLHSIISQIVFDKTLSKNEITQILRNINGGNIGTKTIITIKDGAYTYKIQATYITASARLSIYEQTLGSVNIWESVGAIHWHSQTLGDLAFDATTGILLLPNSAEITETYGDEYWGGSLVQYIDMSPVSIGNNSYYMQYRSASLPTYITGKFYKWTGTAFVIVDDTTNIGDNYDSEDLYRIDTSDLEQNSYYLQTPTYPVDFKNGKIYWYINGEFFEINSTGAGYIPGLIDMADPTALTSGDDAGYYKYTGDNAFYGGGYFPKGIVCYWDGANLSFVVSEMVPAFTVSVGLVNSADTQAFYNTNDFTRSTIRFGAVNINLTTFVLSTSPLIEKVIDMITETNGVNVNDTFILGVQFKGGRTRFKPTKLTTIGASQDLGQIPSLVLSFTE